jgi:EAL domain-containing protein (putative c-di-GMP-specific phosphodiesterase class I)
MDDFGTGYASLSYLHQLPINHLKIDRSFIQYMSDESSEIVRTIITLAHNLGLDVIAEGVEAEAQAQLLKKMQCEYAQGYYYSHPMNSQEIEHLLTTL